MAAATFTSISPAGGPAAGGTSVTITGTNFTGAKSAYVGGVPLSAFKVESSTEITGKTGPYSTDGGTTLKSGPVAVAVVGAENTVESGTGEEKFSYWTPRVRKTEGNRSIEIITLGNNKKAESNAVSYGLELTGTTAQNIPLYIDTSTAKSWALQGTTSEVATAAGEGKYLLESSYDGGTTWLAIPNTAEIELKAASETASTSAKVEEKAIGGLLRIKVTPVKTGKAVVKLIVAVNH